MSKDSSGQRAGHDSDETPRYVGYLCCSCENVQYVQTASPIPPGVLLRTELDNECGVRGTFYCLSCLLSTGALTKLFRISDELIGKTPSEMEGEEKQMTGDDDETILTNEQQARGLALSIARSLLDSPGGMAWSADMIDLANWITTGRAPHLHGERPTDGQEDEDADADMDEDEDVRDTLDTIMWEADADTPHESDDADAEEARNPTWAKKTKASKRSYDDYQRWLEWMDGE